MTKGQRKRLEAISASRRGSSFNPSIVVTEDTPSKRSDPMRHYYRPRELSETEIVSLTEAVTKVFIKEAKVLKS